MSARLIETTSGDRVHVLGSYSTMGRHEGNTVQVLDRIVSKEHCRITQGSDGGYLLRDAGSLNGTWVNGQRVTEHVLKTGDVLQLGSTTFRFEGDAAAVAAPVAMTEAHSEVRSALASEDTFLPAHEQTDVEALREDYEKLRMAHELARRLSITDDLNTLLKSITDATLDLMRADRAVVLLVHPSTNELEPLYVAERGGGTPGTVALSRSILRVVQQEKQAVLSNDAMADERFKGAQSVIMQGIRSAMCVPMIHDGQLLGALHADSKIHHNSFQTKHLRLMQGIASQAAIAIANQKLASRNKHEASTRAQLQRLMSPNLVEQIVSGRMSLDQAGTSTEATMLFADIRGFTSMSEKTTPEEMVRTLNSYFEVMVDVLFKHGGTLDKYVGDEIIGLFGAPVSRPDHAFRAVACGLEMQRALIEFNHVRERDGKPPVLVGVGINTGRVIAGAIGSQQTLQYTVIGDPVNVASRLCGVAKAGEVVISETTVAAAGPGLMYEPREAVSVKGKAAPLRIFNATGAERPERPHQPTQH